MNPLRKGWIAGLFSLGRYVSAMRIPVYAGYACYFIVLSLFPSLVLFLGLLRYMGLSIDTLTGALTGIIPEALLPAARKLILSTYRNTSGTVVSLSALVALWSASRGIYGLLRGLNAIYGIRKDRGYFRTRAVSVGYTFAFLLILLVTLILRVFGAELFPWLPVRMGRRRFLVLLLLLSGLFSAMFSLLPDHRRRLLFCIPGGLFAGLGWLVFSGLFSLYVEHSSGYTSIYGSVYLVALGMLWLYCCISILFYGGALNHYLEKKQAKENPPPFIP